LYTGPEADEKSIGKSRCTKLDTRGNTLIYSEDHICEEREQQIFFETNIRIQQYSD
jgi:hypothetical protein